MEVLTQNTAWSITYEKINFTNNNLIFTNDVTLHFDADDIFSSIERKVSKYRDLNNCFPFIVDALISEIPIE